MTQDENAGLTKEDLDARFTAKLEENRRRREQKLKGEDVAKMLEERAAARAAKRDSTAGKRARIVAASVGAALLLASGVVAATTATGTNAFTSETRGMSQQIAEAKGDLEEIPAADEESSADFSAELEEQIATASLDAVEIANLQQEFATIAAQVDGTGSADGAPSSATLGGAEHRRLLAPYFVEQALLVDDGLAYAPGSILPFESNKIDPRFPWYGAPTPQTPFSRWELVSVTASDTEGVLDVTWLNRSPETGDLYAWATASYYADSSAFGSLTVGLTTLGSGITAGAGAAGGTVVASNDKAGAR